MAQTPYIATQTLKDRLTLGGLPLPLDPDLERLIRTASKMVKVRCVVFPETTGDVPDEVQQVTLMLAMRMRTAEIQNYIQTDGSTPTTVPLWTQDLTDILGTLVRDAQPAGDSPLAPVAGVITTTVPIPSPAGFPDANASRYRGDPNTWPGWGSQRP